MPTEHTVSNKTIPTESESIYVNEDKPIAIYNSKGKFICTAIIINKVRKVRRNIYFMFMPLCYLKVCKKLGISSVSQAIGFIYHGKVSRKGRYWANYYTRQDRKIITYREISKFIKLRNNKKFYEEGTGVRLVSQ